MRAAVEWGESGKRCAEALMTRFSIRAGRLSPGGYGQDPLAVARQNVIRPTIRSHWSSAWQSVRNATAVPRPLATLNAAQRAPAKLRRTWMVRMKKQIRLIERP